MKIIGYGEDALTFWALTNRTTEILQTVGDPTGPDACTILFRPSFGRSGGTKSSQFGEFDFILATPHALHLGEAKWEKSPEVAERVIVLKDEQLNRHRIFSVFYSMWITRDEWEWEAVLKIYEEEFQKRGINKPVPPIDSLLSHNLQSVLKTLSQTTHRSTRIINILLVVDSSGHFDRNQKMAPEGFTLVVINASSDIQEGFITLKK